MNNLEVFQRYKRAYAVMMEVEITHDRYTDQNNINNILQPYIENNLRTDHPNVDAFLIHDVVSAVLCKSENSITQQLYRRIRIAPDYKISHHVFLKLRHKFAAIRLKSRIDHDNVRGMIQYANYLHNSDPLRTSMRKVIGKYNQIDYPNVTITLMEQSAGLLDKILELIGVLHTSSERVLYEVMESNGTININNIGNCAQCATITTNEINVAGNPQFYCSYCVDKYLKFCPQCNSIHYEENFMTCSDQVDTLGRYVEVCSDCWHELYGQCHNCRETARRDVMHAMQFDKVELILCKNCHDNVMNKRFKECSIKGCSNSFDTINRRVIRSNTYNNEDITFGFDNYCDHHLNMITTVLPYGYQPSIRPMNTHKHEGELKKNTATFGFELEFEVVFDKAEVNVVSQTVKNTFGYTKYYVCSDASLGTGAEVISNPFTYQWYRSNKKELIKLHTVMTNAGAMFDHDRVGFHVHQNKDSFSASQMYKLTTLFADCDTLDTLEPIFGRREGEYNLPLEIDRHDRIKTAKDKGNVSADHYDVFHCPTKRKTNEFRMFAGPKSPYHLLAYLETIFALNEWSDQVSPSCVDAYDFMLFCKTQNTYSMLKRLALGEDISKPSMKGKK